MPKTPLPYALREMAFPSPATSYRNTSSVPLLRILTPPHASHPSDGYKSTLPFLSWPPNHGPLTTRAYPRRRNGNASPAPKKNKKKSSIKKGGAEKGEEEEDALEALFSMLEEDLKIDEGEEEEDDEITEEDMDKLQRELEEALGVDVGDDMDDFNRLGMVSDDNGVVGGGGEEEEEVERPVKLKTWQLRRLAFALKTGRRKTSIKSLAGELCLDRAVVLKYLRDPPPSLVMMSAALPDEPPPRLVIPERKPLDVVVPVEKKSVDDVDVDVDAAVGNSGGEVKVPIHVMRHQWYARKRLKKAQVQTLERVYRRTRRPTNAMISSIVQVLNLPRKKVVKWFEDKRNEDGVPDQHLPYVRSVSESTSSCGVMEN